MSENTKALEALRFTFRPEKLEMGVGGYGTPMIVERAAIVVSEHFDSEANDDIDVVEFRSEDVAKYVFNALNMMAMERETKHQATIDAKELGYTYDEPYPTIIDMCRDIRNLLTQLVEAKEQLEQSGDALRGITSMVCVNIESGIIPKILCEDTRYLKAYEVVKQLGLVSQQATRAQPNKESE